MMKAPSIEASVNQRHLKGKFLVTGYSREMCIVQRRKKVTDSRERLRLFLKLKEWHTDMHRVIDTLQ